jgi:hypothetical protein
MRSSVWHTGEASGVSAAAADPAGVIVGKEDAPAASSR